MHPPSLSEQQGDGGAGHMLGVSHIDQLPPFVIGQRASRQSGILLVERSAEQPQVVPNLIKYSDS